MLEIDYLSRFFGGSVVLHARVGRSSSLIWRLLLWGKELLQASLRWRVGDGRSIKIYSDFWLPSRNPSSITSPHVLSFDASVGQLISTGGIWNLDLVSLCFNDSELALILSIPLPDTPIKDLLI